MNDASIDPRYPIGKFERPSQPLTPEQRAEAIDAIAAVPAALRTAVSGLDEMQLHTPYREGGWSVRQVVHHVPDSHMNAYVRTKLALTQEQPAIQGYDEAAWAKTGEVAATRIETSLTLLEALHDRWVTLLRNMSEADFARTLMHSERGPMSLDMLVALYAWHGRHHTAHITTLRQQQGW